MTEVIITKVKLIVVDNVNINEYGDLTFTDKEGSSYKIPNKRKSYFEKTILPNQGVQLNYAKYMNKEYIYSADLVKDKIPVQEIAKPPPETPQAKATPPSTPAPSVPIPGQQIGMVVKELGDMIRAVKMKEIFGVEAAAELVKWYRSQILGTTKIECDGSKLPQFNPQKKEAP